MSHNNIQTQVNVEKVTVVKDSYALYDISIRIVNNGVELWNTTIEKRFSDFVELRKRLLSETQKNSNSHDTRNAIDVPYELPNKQYGIWKVNKSISDAVVEERRRKLGSFLYELLNDSFDTKWKNSVAVRDFLNLPGAKNWSSLIKDKLNKSGLVGTDDTADDSEDWLTEFRNCKNTIEEIKQLDSSKKLQNLMKLRLKVSKLEDLLSQTSNSEAIINISSNERKRRLNLLSVLKDDINEFALQDDVMDSKDSANISNDRMSRQVRSDGGVDEFKNSQTTIRPNGRRRLGETANTEPLGNQQLLQYNKMISKDQDQELAQLHKVIQRQKLLSIEMNEELQQQNEYLTSFEADVDRTASKLGKAHRDAQRFNENS